MWLDAQTQCQTARTSSSVRRSNSQKQNQSCHEIKSEACLAKSADLYRFKLNSQSSRISLFYLSRSKQKNRNCTLKRDFTFSTCSLLRLSSIQLSVKMRSLPATVQLKFPKNKEARVTIRYMKSMM